MNRYPDTREQSAELLRLALPLMSRQSAALHPVSYAVWYEYVSGRNPELREGVDGVLSGETPLDDVAIEDLHTRFIAGRDAVAAVRMQSGLERIVAEMTEQVAAAGQQADQFGHSLDRCSETLRGGVDPEALGAIVKTLVAETRRMHDSAAELGGRLRAGTQEVEQLRAELVRARGEAHTDPLTGVLNRRGMDQALAAMQSAAGVLADFCVLLIDIDHFKDCNDNYGHLFGDRVIRATAQVILKLVRSQDSVARMGGEEFAILLPRTVLDHARTLAERIRTTIKHGRIKRLETGELIGNITVSLGVAGHRAGETFEDVMGRADAAMYAAKRGGRDRVSVAGVGDPDDGTGFAAGVPYRDHPSGAAPIAAA